MLKLTDKNNIVIMSESIYENIYNKKSVGITILLSPPNSCSNTSGNIIYCNSKEEILDKIKEYPDKKVYIVNDTNMRNMFDSDTHTWVTLFEECQDIGSEGSEETMEMRNENLWDSAGDEDMPIGLFGD